jgi:hypothetical protein
VNPQRYLMGEIEVEAVQVPDDLGAVMAIADWIHTNGGRLTDPMTTFDCAFRLYTVNGKLPVNVGDWVSRSVASGAFYRHKPDVFTQCSTAVAS